MDILRPSASHYVTIPLNNMINLLSVRAKNALWKEYRVRLVIVVLAALLLLQTLVAVLFFPTFFMLRSTTAALALDVEKQKGGSPQNGNDSARELTVIKNEIALLRPTASSSDMLVSDMISSILGVKPKGIAVDQFAYQKEKNITNIQISGVANTREDILAFKNTLSTNPAFRVRANDYILKKTNIAFTITLSLK